MCFIPENSDEEMEASVGVEVGGATECRGLSGFAVSCRVEEGVVTMWPEVSHCSTMSSYWTPHAADSAGS